MRVDNNSIDQLITVIPNAAFVVNKSLTITHFNEAAANLTGCPADKAIGQKCHQIFRSSRCDSNCIIKACMEKGEPLVGEDVEMTGANDNKIDALANATPLFSENGVTIGGIEILRDITEEKNLKQQLEEDQDRLDEFHNSTMELAMGISECFQVLSETRMGNLDARVSEQTLSSSDELMANLGQELNLSLDAIENQLETIRRQQSAIQELSTPILQLWDNVLALPVIGVVDTRRSAEIMERLLAEITERQSRYVILDITGVEVVDTRTADHFIKVIKAAELLGSTCILTGIRPAVAQTLVDLGIDLSNITTLRNLQEGLKECRRLMEEWDENVVTTIQ
ncbi:MAG: PAS domain-containing protein [Deltaproteobacteria bacterium]|nr:PAS domain-containing protein [Deltaproteobacteria bacterium]